MLLVAALPAVGSGVTKLSFDLVVPGGLVALLPVLPAWALPLPLPEVPEADLPELAELPDVPMPDAPDLPAVGAGIVALSFDLVVPAGLSA